VYLRRQTTLWNIKLLSVFLYKWLCFINLISYNLKKTILMQISSFSTILWNQGILDPMTKAINYLFLSPSAILNSYIDCHSYTRHLMFRCSAIIMHFYLTLPSSLWEMEIVLLEIVQIIKTLYNNLSFTLFESKNIINSFILYKFFFLSRWCTRFN